MSDKILTLAIDAMGGYQAPAEVVAAVAAASLVGRPGVFFTLVGDEAILTSALNQLNHNPERITLAHAEGVIELGEPAMAAFDRKPQCSIAVACELVAQGQADVVISAGHPGAAILAAQRHFTLLPGVRRAALASVYPTPHGHGEHDDRFSLILDVGASLEATGQDLVDFAIMGAAYARQITENLKPKVALLSISREANVGPAAIVEAHAALTKLEGIEFLGNIEGHDIPRGLADVIVCEGYVGDVAIKLLEGIGETAMELARSAYEESFIYRQGLRLLSGGIKKLRQLIDFEEYGGAPLLGCQQLMILAHPRSGRRALDNAIKLGIKTTRQDLSGYMAQALAYQAVHRSPQAEADEPSTDDAPAADHESTPESP